MSAPFAIPTAGNRCVWVFCVDLTEEDVNAMSEEELGESFGLWSRIARSSTECFAAETLHDYGFANYISQANGMDVSDDEGAKLNALHGTVFLLFSQALDDVEHNDVIAPELPFVFVGRYDLKSQVPDMDKLRAKSAEGLLAQGRPTDKPAKSDARMSGMVATFVLVFLAVFVALFVWVGA